MAENRVPRLLYATPDLNHKKEQPYVDYPLVYNETVTERAFYIEFDFTFVTSDSANTTLYKWNGNSWEAITGMTNPDVIFGRGFYAVTTAADAYVAITEHYVTS